MCGIVGYAGPADGTGRRWTSSSRGCGGSSTAGTTRPGWRCRLDRPGDGEAGRQAATAGRRPGRRADPGRHHRHRAHPLGHARRPDRPERAPARRRQGRRGGDPQRHHRELRAAQGRAARRGRRVQQRDRHRGGRAPAGPRVRRDARPDRGDARRRPPGWRARTRCSRCTPRCRTRWSAPAGTRRWWSGRRGRELPRLRRGGLHRPHPGGDRARPGPGGDDHARLGLDHRRRRQPGGGQAYHVDWDAAAAEKGGFPSFMAKEIADQPQAVADTLLGRTDAGPAGAGRAADRRGGAARRRQDRRHRLRHRRLRRDGREVRDRALVPDARGGGAGARVSATATRWWTTARWWSRSRSPARRWTR
jgi:hypothetical protein